MDTIYALASAQGKSGVAVIRISGPDAFASVNALAGRIPSPRQASLMILKDSDGVRLDQAIVLTFGENSSFTGEETAELHLHGSRAIINAVFRALSMIKGLRLAEPGEFTRRALLNGKLDLTEVEGLADLIEAETETQRRQALRVFSGDLGRKVEEWRAKLTRALALLEVTIDFADEDVPDDVTREVRDLLRQVQTDLSSEEAGVHAAERVRDGFEVAILGPPNIGKSTLLNALAGREAAITSEIAGTTRDVIEVRMDLDGLPVTFLDTAGLRETDDQIESIGIKRAISRAEAADLRVVLIENTLPPLVTLEPDDIVLSGKADRPGSPSGISGKTGLGVTELLSSVSGILGQRAASAGVAVQERHRVAIAKARVMLDGVDQDIDLFSEAPEILSERLREIVATLDSLVGRIGVESVLDEIFSSFCLGK